MNLISLFCILAFAMGIFFRKKNKAVTYVFGGIGFVLGLLWFLLGVL